MNLRGTKEEKVNSREVLVLTRNREDEPNGTHSVGMVKDDLLNKSETSMITAKSNARREE